MDEMQYVIEREEETAPPSFDISSFDVLAEESPIADEAETFHQDLAAFRADFHRDLAAIRAGILGAEDAVA